MIDVIIVENSQACIDSIKSLIETYHTDLKIRAICKTKEEAVTEIKRFEPHLVFLDIELDDAKAGGIEVLKETRDLHYSVVFTTAYNNYAEEAFEFSAVHYLIKVVTREKLEKAIFKFKERVDSDSVKTKELFLNNLLQSDKLLKTFAIPALGGETICKQVSEIIYCEANVSASILYFPGKTKQASIKSLEWVEERLSPYNFLRCHRSYLVNFSKIIKFKRDGDSGLLILKDLDHHIPVARRKVRAVEQLLGL